VRSDAIPLEEQHLMPVPAEALGDCASDHPASDDHYPGHCASILATMPIPCPRQPLKIVVMTVHPPRIRYDQRAPMRDGVELSADVYLPGEGEGPWPAILYRTPYDNSTAAFPELGRYHAGRGYAFVAQDVRGRGDSDGRFEPFVAEAADGHDTVEWVAAQPWCDGAVGMMGGSYAGFVQWVAARERPPHLRALVSTAAAGRWMEELPYRFGSNAAPGDDDVTVIAHNTVHHTIACPSHVLLPIRR
jgi:pimeloyl-ACP methyl ester carboxylesterase